MTVKCDTPAKQQHDASATLNRAIWNVPSPRSPERRPASSHLPPPPPPRQKPSPQPRSPGDRFWSHHRATMACFCFVVPPAPKNPPPSPLQTATHSGSGHGHDREIMRRRSRPSLGFRPPSATAPAERMRFRSDASFPRPPKLAAPNRCRDTEPIGHADADPPGWMPPGSAGVALRQASIRHKRLTPQRYAPGPLHLFRWPLDGQPTRPAFGLYRFAVEV